MNTGTSGSSKLLITKVKCHTGINQERKGRKGEAADDFCSNNVFPLPGTQSCHGSQIHILRNRHSLIHTFCLCCAI